MTKYLDIELDDSVFQPVSTITFTFKSGAKVTITTPLSPVDFTTIWERKFSKVKIITGKDSFIYINKRSVDSYIISPL